MKKPSQVASDELILRIQSGFPLLWLQTEETARAAATLQIRIAEENEKINATIARLKSEGLAIPEGLNTNEILVWDILNGLVNLTTGQCLLPVRMGERDPNQNTPAYKHILSWGGQVEDVTIPKYCVILINGFHNLLASTAEVGRIRAAFLQIIQPITKQIKTEKGDVNFVGLREGDNFRTVVLLSPKLDHPALSQDVISYIEKIDFPRPSTEEIKEVIQIQMKDRQTREGEDVLKDEKNLSHCVEELQGTTLSQVENAIGLTYRKHQKIDQAELRHQYKKIIELHPSLELGSFEETWENLVGFEVYKQYMEALFHKDTPEEDRKGILFVGTSGGGKSHAAKATGNHFGMRTLICNVGRIFHKHVGSSEENADNMFKFINGSGKSNIFIDELEKAFGGMGGGGDSGTSDRVLQNFLIWMNDHPAGPFLMGTSNDLGHGKLPEEFLREGRWNCIFFVPPPSLKQRIQLFELYGAASRIENIDMREHAEKTKNWSGAEIKGLLEKAKTLKVIYPQEETAIDHAYKLVKPLCDSNPEKFEERITDGKKRGVSVNADEEEELIVKTDAPPAAKISQRRNIL